LAAENSEKNKLISENDNIKKHWLLFKASTALQKYSHSIANKDTFLTTAKSFCTNVIIVGIVAHKNRLLSLEYLRYADLAQV
jgi:hypothetical protein